jgi:hypothetical protein
MSDKFDRWLQCRSCGEQVHIRVWLNIKGIPLVEVVSDVPDLTEGAKSSE